MIEKTNKFGFIVKILADSVSYGKRITTMELKYPRFIHAEFMTHRMFSRNASSSRAIPVERMLENTGAAPIHWGANRPGMSADKECNAIVSKGVHGPDLTRDDVWSHAREDAVTAATLLSEVGYHKQIVNRLTEPFQFIKVVVTATEWDNFYGLRIDKAAQPEIHELATMMREAQESSTPEELVEGDWHLPYYKDGFWKNSGNGLDFSDISLEDARYTSSAGCARVSYDNHDGSEVDPVKDAKLSEMLKEMKHMSPFEHQAKPMGMRPVDIDEEYNISFSEGVTHIDRKGQVWSANFNSWIQLRQMESFYE